MKGQSSSPMAIAITVVTFASTILVAMMVFGYVVNEYPHDQTINNETICSTCVNNTIYEIDYDPLINDTTLVCYSGSVNAMTNGYADDTCLTYNVTTDLTGIVIGNTSGPSNCYTADVVCTYTYDEANTNEQNFFNTSETNVYGGFLLMSIIAVILAAIVIMGIVVLIRA